MKKSHELLEAILKPNTPEAKYRALAFLPLIALVILSPLLSRSVFNIETTSSSIHPWIPAGTETKAQFERFDELFGPEDYWLLAISNPDYDDKIAELTEVIRERNEARENTLLRRIRTGSEAIEGLPEEAKKSVKEELRGVLFSQSGDHELIFMESTDYGFRNRSEVFSELIEPAIDAYESEAGIKVIGPGYIGVMADRETRKTLVGITPFTLLLSGLLALLLLKNAKLTLIVMLTSGVAAVIPIALVYYSGNTLSHLLVVIPSLAQLLALSNSIHLIEYYREALESRREGRPAWLVALTNGWAPTTAAAVTTIIGFLSLQVSSLPVVKTFSLFGSIAIGCSAIVVLIFVPAFLILLHPRVTRTDWIGSRLVPSLDSAVSRNRAVFYVPLLLIFLASFLGLTKLQTETRTELFFPEDSELRTNMSWFETEFGHLQACQLFRRFDSSVSIENQWRSVAATLEKLDGITENSCRVFTPIPGDIYEKIREEAGSEAATQWLVDRATSEEVFRETEDGHYWRITLYHEPVAEIENAPFYSSLRSKLNSADEGESDEWVITGTYHLFADAQRILMSELMKTFLLAFLLITPCVIAFLRNLKLGLVAIVGNLFPVIVFFGLIGFLAVRVDIATMIIASIAFGIAVDDTIHYLTWLKRSELLQDTDVRKRITFAYRRAGAAIIKTTLIISLGMLAFLFSDFGPSRRFATFTAIVLFLAAIGDLLLLPSLIGGPFARLFGTEKKEQ